jgi:hypothetical protein
MHRGKQHASTGHKLPRIGRPKQQSGMQKMIGKLGGLVGGTKKSSRSRPSPKQGVGLAALAGAAGLAMKNRDKLMGMLGRKDHSQENVDTTPAVPASPAEAAPPHPLDNRP